MPSLLERHRAVMPKWVALYYEEPIALVRGDGRRVWDQEGRKYLDFFGGILTTLSGHNVPAVTEAIREQAGRILHSSTLYLIESQVELAEEIARLSGIPDAKVFFTNSGTEANDTALMLATTHRQSNQIIALRNSYHGRSFSAISVTGTRSWSASSLSPFSVIYVHGGYRLRSPFADLSDQEYIDVCRGDLRDMMQVSSAGDVACMIAEPIQGVGGFITPPDGLLGAFRQELAESGTLLVSDEVQTGWGRTGEHFWGYQAHDMVPDILTFAKGLGNGLAIAGLVARAELMDSISAQSISTFGGNPLATSGALANLRFLIDEDLQGNTHRVGTALKERFEALAGRNDRIAEVRGKGLMLGIELVKGAGDDPNEPDAGLTARLFEETKKRGLLIGRGGIFGNVIRIAPPMSLTEDEMLEGVELFEQSFEAAL